MSFTVFVSQWDPTPRNMFFLYIKSWSPFPFSFSLFFILSLYQHQFTLRVQPDIHSFTHSSCKTMTEQIQAEQSNMPTFVKQLLLLVLPSKQQHQQVDNKSQGNSPFEKMYFSFPALEEDGIDNSNTCGQQQDQRHKSKPSTTTNSSIVC